MLLLGIAASIRPTGAGELSGYVELLYNDTQTDVEGSPQSTVETDAEFFRQRYSLNFVQDPFPTVSFAVGGLFEQADARQNTDGLRLESEDELLYPYARIGLSTSYYSGELAFERQQRRTEFDVFAVDRSRRDLYRGTLAWTPPKLPVVRLELLRTQDYRGSDLELARIDDIVQLSSDYHRKGLYAYYRGFVQDVDNRVDDARLESTNHAGRVRYGGQTWHGRFSYNADGAVDYGRNKTTRSGVGEFDTDVAAIAGLSSIDDTPQSDPLLPNPLLIDDNFLAGAGVNLGLPPPAGDDRPRNIGFDLGSAMPLNTLRIWVDRPLPAVIAASFSWDVYVSDDNDLWTLAGTFPLVPLAPFDNYFELSTGTLDVRYVKVVVSPLEPTDPFATNFPEILVTEIEAILRSPFVPSAASTEESTTTQRLTLSARARLLESFPLYYELSHFVVDSNVAASRYSLANGISAASRFGEIYDFSARLTRTDSRTGDEDLTSHAFSTSLGATPLETLRQSVVCSFTRNERDAGTTDFASVFLHNDLEIRRGIEFALSIGRSYSVNVDDRTTSIESLTTGLTLDPHPTTTVTLSLQDRDVDTPTGTNTGSRRSSALSVSWRPVSAVYVFASHGTNEIDASPERDTNTVLIGWSPFPDGTLQFTINYGETNRTAPDETTKGLTPSLRWNISPNIYFETTYAQFESDTPNVRTDTDAVTATFRATF